MIQERKITTNQAHQTGQKGNANPECPPITSPYRDSQKQVHEVVNQAYQTNDQNNLAILPDPQLQDILTHWLQEITQAHLQSNIYHFYHELIDLHLIPALGGFSLRSILPQQVQQFYNQKYAEGYSTQIIECFHYILQQSLATALHSHLIDKNICDTIDPTYKPKDATSTNLSHLDIKHICRILVHIAVHFEENDHEKFPSQGQ